MKCTQSQLEILHSYPPLHQAQETIYELLLCFVVEGGAGLYSSQEDWAQDSSRSSIENGK